MTVTDTVTKDDSQSALRGLFGRDMVYMVLWATQLILAAVLTPVTTRLLGPSRFGIVATAIAVTQILVAIGSFSLQTAVQRAFAEPGGEERARKLVGLAVGIAAITFEVAYGTGGLWSSAIGLGHFSEPVKLAVAWAALTAVSNAALGLIRSRDQIVLFTVVSMLQSVIAEALALGLVILVRRTASEYLLGQMLAQAATVAVAVVAVRPRLPTRGDARMVGDALAYAGGLVPTAISAFVLDASDRLVIQGDLGSAAVARYAVARNIGGFALIMLGLLNSVWMPRFFALKDAASQRITLAQSRDGIYVLVIGAVPAISMAAPLLLWIWAPSSFRPLHLVLITTLVAVTAIPLAGTMAAGRTLMLRGKTTPIAVGTFVAAGANLGMNLVLVPLIGIDGSALATLLCFSLQLVILSRASQRAMQVPRPSTALVGCAVIAVAVSLASSEMGTGPLSIAIRSLVVVGAALGVGAQVIVVISPERASRAQSLARRLASAGRGSRGGDAHGA